MRLVMDSSKYNVKSQDDDVGLHLQFSNYSSEDWL